MIRHNRYLMLVLSGFFASTCLLAADQNKPLSIKEARVTITGHDFNVPDPFPGMGDFGWPGSITRLSDGRLMMVHSRGWWHASFASPNLFAPHLGWNFDWKAPTGGRSMCTYSADEGKSWSKPETLIDLPLDDRPYSILRCKDGTLLVFINVQASWYGFDEAPEQFANDIGGLNTQQCVVRSTDGGKSWSKPIWLRSPGGFYERGNGQPLELPGGGILWPTCFTDTRTRPLGGAIHRSDDQGKTWHLVSVLRRRPPGVTGGGDLADQEPAGISPDETKQGNIDEPAIILLKDGRLLLATRPDGALYTSKDLGVSWEPAGRLFSDSKFKAPQLFTLSDGRIVCICTHRGCLQCYLGSSDGKDWTSPITIDSGSYGYPTGMRLNDDTILVAYTSAGGPPNRLYLVRIKLNDRRDGVELVPVGEEPRASKPSTKSAESEGQTRS